MGRAVAAAVEADPGAEVAARFDQPGATGEGLVSLADALAASDVIIDFTLPAGSVALAQAAAARGGPALVIGPTGFEDAQLAEIAKAAKKAPIVREGNFWL